MNIYTLTLKFINIKLIQISLMQMFAHNVVLNLFRTYSVYKLSLITEVSSEYLTGSITLEVASTLRTLLCAGVEILELLNALQVSRNAIDRG